MTDLYTKPTISGYNSSPPSDDGSETEANEIKWSKHKTKLTDPIKALVDAINTAVNTAFTKVFGNAVTAISSATNLATSHQGKFIKSTNATTLTLLAGGTAGSNFIFAFYNADSSNNLTLGRNSMNINGAASNLTVLPGEGGIGQCDGTDWWVVAGSNLIDEDTFATNSATRPPSQQSVAAYISNLTGGNVLAPHEGLVCKYVTAATADIDADAVLLKTSGGLLHKASSVNLTLTISGTGANGRDIEENSGSEKASDWYYLWVIYNGTTVASFATLASTFPTDLPSGYTYAGLVGAVYNDSGSDFDDFHQVGNLAVTMPVTVLADGGSESYASVALATVVPDIAKRVSGISQVDDSASGQANTFIAATSAGLGELSVKDQSGSTAKMGYQFSITVVEAQTIYYKVTAAANDDLTIIVSGWEY